MSDGRRRIGFCLWCVSALWLLGSAAGARPDAAQPASAAQPTRPGFDLCVRPAYPGCIDAAETYRRKEAVAACQAALSGYVAAAVTYRTCMQREIESINLRANSVIDFFKCRSDHHKACPPLMFDSGGPCTSGDCGH